MRPCATVLRKIFPCSIPRSRRLATYSACPVTLARASSRGRLRPTSPKLQPPSRACCRNLKSAALMREHVLGDLRARSHPDIGRRRRLLDYFLVVVGAAMVPEDVCVAGHVDNAKLSVTFACNRDDLLERVMHRLWRAAV